MPPEMPESIAGQANILAGVNVSVPGLIGEGSGVNISLGRQFYTLTAGHVLSAGSFNWKPGIYGCKESNEITTLHDEGGTPKSTSTARVIAAAGHFSLVGGSFQHYSKPDVALLKTTPTPYVALAENYIGAKATLNQIAWFENYQTGKKDSRRPGFNGIRGQPVEFAGRVIAITDRTAFVLTALGAHYGAHKDDQLHGGGSGGPVWVQESTNKGKEVRLLGLSNATLLKTFSAMDIQNNFGVYLEGAQPGQQFTVDIVGRTTPKELRDLKARIKPCS